MRIKALLSTMVVLVLAGPTLAQSAPPPVTGADAAAPATKLKGRTAWQALVGNTVEIKTRTGGYSEFFAHDGKVVHLDRDGTSTGTWALQDPKICFDYPEEDDRSCVAVEVEGTHGAFVDDDASRDAFEILPGNAKNL